MGNLDAGWLWTIGGLLLLMAEIIAPGFFLIFIGAAAIATGIFTLLFDLGLAPQLILFVIYSAVAVLVYQGFWTVLGVLLGGFLPPAEIAAITAVGGILLVGVALRLLRIRDVPVADLLPALLVAPILTALVAALR